MGHQILRRPKIGAIILFCILIALINCPAIAFAESLQSASLLAANTQVDSATATLDESTGTLIVSGSGVYSDSVYAGDARVKTIVVGSEVTGLGSSVGVFAGCTNLVSLDLSAATSLVSIGDYAFQDCSALTGDINLSSASSIGTCAFKNCTSITSITLPEGLAATYTGDFGGWTSSQTVNLYLGTRFASDDNEAVLNWLTPSGYPKTDDYGNYVAEGVSGACTWKLYEAYNAGDGAISNALVIAGEGAMGDNAGLGMSLGDRPVHLIVCEGVTEIGKNAFSNSTSIQDASLPATLMKIGDNAFRNATALKSVSFAENCALTTIASNLGPAFSGQTDLVLDLSNTSINNSTIPLFDTSTFSVSVKKLILPKSMERLREQMILENRTGGLGALSIEEVVVPASLTTFSKRTSPDPATKTFVCPCTLDKTIISLFGQRVVAGGGVLITHGDADVDNPLLAFAVDGDGDVVFGPDGNPTVSAGYPCKDCGEPIQDATIIGDVCFSTEVKTAPSAGGDGVVTITATATVDGKELTKSVDRAMMAAETYEYSVKEFKDSLAQAGIVYEYDDEKTLAENIVAAFDQGKAEAKESIARAACNAVDAEYDINKSAEENIAAITDAVNETVNNAAMQAIAETEAKYEGYVSTEEAKAAAEKAAADTESKYAGYVSPADAKAAADSAAAKATAAAEANGLKANTMIVKTKTVKASATKNKTFKKTKAFTVKNAKGKVTFYKLSGNEKITVTKAGKVKVKKGLKAKKKPYKVKVLVCAAGNKGYAPAYRTVTLKVKVK